MSAFTFAKLDKDETIVFGPVTFSSSSSFSFNAGRAQGVQVNKVNKRTIAITDRRIIIEQGPNPQDNQSIPNKNVKRVYVERGQAGLKVDKVETIHGQTVELDLGGIRPHEEARLFEIFPGAEIGEKKGLFGGFARITPRAIPAPRVPPPPKPGAAKRVPPAARPAPSSPGQGFPRKSHIDDADIHGLDDLRRYYPLSAEYDYIQTAEGEYMVKRLQDGAQFAILLEEELLGFDVPVQDPKRKKVTVEIFKKK
jgi:hypothetical protein